MHTIAPGDKCVIGRLAQVAQVKEELNTSKQNVNTLIQTDCTKYSLKSQIQE